MKISFFVDTTVKKLLMFFALYTGNLCSKESKKNSILSCVGEGKFAYQSGI